MKKHEYTDGETHFEGHWALEESIPHARPGILVAHAWDGPNDYFNSLAQSYGKRGFVALALDVYGKGKRGRIDGDNSHLMNPLLEDRTLLQKRLLAALSEIQKHPLVIPDRIAIVGYCFGGLCALDLARAAPEGLRAAISIHGSLVPPAGRAPKPITSSVLVLHGWEDPVAPQSDVLRFTDEMTRAKADWQLHCYGHAKHAFTFVGADIPELGIKYNEKAHRRAEKTSDAFLRELLLRAD